MRARIETECLDAVEGERLEEELAEVDESTVIGVHDGCHVEYKLLCTSCALHSEDT